MNANNLILKKNLGKHCCLFCNIPNGHLKIKPSQRNIPIETRTLATLKRDHDSFIASGGNIKQAMLHNNVILPAYFDIPLDQVI